MDIEDRKEADQHEAVQHKVGSTTDADRVRDFVREVR